MESEHGSWYYTALSDLRCCSFYPDGEQSSETKSQCQWHKAIIEWDFSLLAYDLTMGQLIEPSNWGDNNEIRPEESWSVCDNKLVVLSLLHLLHQQSGGLLVLQAALWQELAEHWTRTQHVVSVWLLRPQVHPYQTCRGTYIQLQLILPTTDELLLLGNAVTHPSALKNVYWYFNMLFPQ